MKSLPAVSVAISVSPLNPQRSGQLYKEDWSFGHFAVVSFLS